MYMLLIYIYIHIYERLCACMCVYVYVYMYVCMCMYTFIKPSSLPHFCIAAKRGFSTEGALVFPCATRTHHSTDQMAERDSECKGSEESTDYQHRSVPHQSSAEMKGLVLLMEDGLLPNDLLY